MANRTEVLKAVIGFMEKHGKVLTEKEYVSQTDAPFSFRFLHRNFGSWKRVIARCDALFPARMAELRAGVGQVEVKPEPVKVEGTNTVLAALAALKASRVGINNEE